jgi:hypothetical protein
MVKHDRNMYVLQIEKKIFIICTFCWFFISKSRTIRLLSLWAIKVCFRVTLSLPFILAKEWTCGLVKQRLRSKFLQSLSLPIHQYSVLTDGMTVARCHYNPVMAAFTPDPGQKLENLVCKHRHALLLFALTCDSSRLDYQHPSDDSNL